MAAWSPPVPLPYPCLLGFSQSALSQDWPACLVWIQIFLCNLYLALCSLPKVREGFKQTKKLANYPLLVDKGRGDPQRWIGNERGGGGARDGLQRVDEVDFFYHFYVFLLLVFLSIYQLLFSIYVAITNKKVKQKKNIARITKSCPENISLVVEVSSYIFF